MSRRPAILLAALLLAMAPAVSGGPAAAQFLIVGDPDNPPDPTPPDTVDSSGLCADGVTICGNDNNCNQLGAPTPCTKFEWPEEYQLTGDVAYVFQVSRLPVSVTQFAAYLNGTGREAEPDNNSGVPLAVAGYMSANGVRMLPPLLAGTPGNYTVLEPDYPWPYANRDHAMRYVNWRGDGDETTGSYDCTGAHCDPQRLPGARLFLLSLDEYRKASGWDAVTQSWWPQPGNGGAQPEPGVDANVASAPTWGTGFGSCDIGTNYPSAICNPIPSGSFPHYVSPWGIEDLCGNGIEISDTCGELLGEVDCDRMIVHGIHPWFGAKDCMTVALAQGQAHTGFEGQPLKFVGTKIRLARTPPPRCGLLGLEGFAVLGGARLVRRAVRSSRAARGVAA